MGRYTGFTMMLLPGKMKGVRVDFNNLHLTAPSVMNIELVYYPAERLSVFERICTEKHTTF